MDYVFLLENSFEDALLLTQELNSICSKIKAVTITNHTVPPFVCVHATEELDHIEHNMVKLKIQEIVTNTENAEENNEEENEGEGNKEEENREKERDY